MYKFKLKSLFKGIDPDKAVQEIERIEAVYGTISPEVIVNEAAKVDNPLHQYFQWDDEKAANNYRLQQARVLINNIEVEIISGGGEKTYMAAYEIGAAKSYKNIVNFDKDDIEFVKQNTKTEIMYLQNKLKRYQQFNKIIEILSTAVSEVEAI